MTRKSARMQTKDKKESWLADFLGASNRIEKKDAAKLTGLKVVLGGEKDKDLRQELNYFCLPFIPVQI